MYSLGHHRYLPVLTHSVPTRRASDLNQPAEVADNGQFTVMRFPNQRELPAFFIVNPGGSEAIAAFDVRDEYVVLHGVYRTIRLRRGLEVLCIHNQDRKSTLLNYSP